MIRRSIDAAEKNVAYTSNIDITEKSMYSLSRLRRNGASVEKGNTIGSLLKITNTMTSVRTETIKLAKMGFAEASSEIPIMYLPSGGCSKLNSLGLHPCTYSHPARA
jgi:hypothetical protein